mmetsp:Transcript_44772/g.90326  ORF Transcript_44772/g.90326 Transcript_44772/m.90326 type:complete len:251 (+) Transcript_44772:188-940(+)
MGKVGLRARDSGEAPVEKCADPDSAVLQVRGGERGESVLRPLLAAQLRDHELKSGQAEGVIATLYVLSEDRLHAFPAAHSRRRRRRYGRCRQVPGGRRVGRRGRGGNGLLALLDDVPVPLEHLNELVLCDLHVLPVLHVAGDVHRQAVLLLDLADVLEVDDAVRASGLDEGRVDVRASHLQLHVPALLGDAAVALEHVHELMVSDLHVLPVFHVGGDAHRQPELRLEGADLAEVDAAIAAAQALELGLQL